MSLPRSIVGKRHCRFLMVRHFGFAQCNASHAPTAMGNINSDATGFDITQFNLERNNRIPFAVTIKDVPVSASTATANPTNPKVPNNKNSAFVTKEKITFCRITDTVRRLKSTA